METVRVGASLPRATLRRERLIGGYALAVLGTAALVLLLRVIAGTKPLSSETTIMMALVVATALVGGLLPAIVAAVLAGLALNLFFVPPYGTLAIADPANAVAILVFLLTGIAVAMVVNLAARTTQQAQLARSEADTLAALATRLLRAGSSQELLLAEACRTLGLQGAAIVRLTADGQAIVEARHGVLESSLSESSVTVGPGVRLLLHGRQLGPQDQAIVTAYAAHLAVLRERQEAAAESVRAAELAEATRIRTALLAAVSHDLRTPLATVKAAASSLRSTEVSWSAADQADLLEAIVGGCDRLENLIDNLLDLSRLQIGTVNPLIVETDLAEAVTSTLDSIPDAERLRVDVPGGLTVHVDPGLLDRVLANLVENALHHTPQGTKISLTAAPTGGGEPAGRVQVRVVDHGDGVPADRLDGLFLPFQRLGDVPQGEGLGLGLAVARGLTEAMGGTVRAEETAGGGLTVVVDLPTTTGNLE